MALPRVLSAVPNIWPVQIEIMRAAHTLMKQIEEDEQHSNLKKAIIADANSDLFAEIFSEFHQQLRKAGFNPNEPRVPAGNPDGGQWTTGEGSVGHNDPHVISDATPNNAWIPGTRYAANDQSGPAENRQPPEIPQDKPGTPQAVNTFLKAAAYFLAGAALAGEPVGDFVLALEAADWLSQYLPWIYSYLDAPKTIEELQQAALNPQLGYNVHHIVEQTPALQDGFPPSIVDSPENLVLVPALTHWLISAWFATKNSEFGYQSPRDYLRGKTWQERMRVGKDALVQFGVLVP